MHLYTPAKINLRLRVLGRRDDGFHEIESLFLPLDLADSLEIEPAPGSEISLTCDDPALPVDDGNLVMKAASLFREHTRVREGVRIHLSKSIPHGAGLGGGSSDAAATLRGLNAFFETGLEHSALEELAARLGSNVPFFVAGKPAICRGRGEQMERVDFPHSLPLLLLKPPFAVSTPWAYGRWREARELHGVRYEIQRIARGELINDLERPVFEKFIFLANLKEWLREQPEAEGALMSGSGSTVFAVLKEATGAKALAERAMEMFGETLWTRAVVAG